MRQFVPVPGVQSAIPSIFLRVFDGLKNLVDESLNRIFSLTHHASRLRWYALWVIISLVWLFAILFIVPEQMFRKQLGILLFSLGALLTGDPQPFLQAGLTFLLTVVLHPVVIKFGIALFAPFWLLHRVTSLYLADIFEETEASARHFIIEATFGRDYRSINIAQGMVSAEDAKSSTIIKIGGPGYAKVDLDSAALFERPDGTPHVILPGKKEIIDDFERLRRVIDVRDVVETIDLPPTRTKDGIFVGARNIQFSYSVYRGNSPDRTNIPYPCEPAAVESLVYKDGRTVKPGIRPSPTPEWQLGQFKMGGAVIGEIGAFVSKLGLSDFLAAIGEPEEKKLLERETEIRQTSQTLSGSGENANPDKPPLEAPKNFSPRTALTEAFYNQNDFVRRMAEKGFQLNWIGVGTWYTPAEIILDNHREAWRLSRENLARGSQDALNAVRSEATLQELLRLIQIPVYQFFNHFDLLQSGDEKPLDDILQEYDDILSRALDLYRVGPGALEPKFARLVQQADALLYATQSNNPDYIELLNQLASCLKDTSFTTLQINGESLQQAAPLYEGLQQELQEQDKQFLLAVNALYNELRNFNKIQHALNLIHTHKQFYWISGRT